MTPKQLSDTIFTFVSEKLPQVLLYALLALLPLLFIPFTADFFEINKAALLFVVSACITLSWVVQSILKQSVRITVTPLTIPMVAFVCALLVSTFVSTPYAFEAVIGRGLVMFSLAAIVFFGITVQKEYSSKIYLWVVTASAGILAVISVLEAFGFGLSNLLNLALNIQLPTKGGFSPTGSPLAGLMFLAPVAVIQLVELVLSKTKQSRIFHGVATAILTAGVAAHLFVMLPGKPGEPIFTPFSLSWSVAIDSLKQAKTALIGYGPESYSVAFTQYRPLMLNTTQYWNVLFTSSHSEILNLVSTLGILGTVAWIVVLLSILRIALPMKKETRSMSILVVLLILQQFVLPATTVNTVVLLVTATLLAISLKQGKDERISDILLHLFAIRIVAPGTADKVQQHLASRALAIIIALAVLAGLGTSAYFLSRVYAADIFMYQSLRAAQQNDGKKTYELQGKVVNLVPLSDRYRRAFASTNFLIAENLADNPAATDQDRNTIPQLIQQSIREAKAATELDNRKTLNWQTLATIYRALVNVAQGADQWAIAAYVRAIQTDPTNPMLRLDLGGVYVSIQNYEQAIRLFQQAAELKPDWPNAHYNLANAYKLKGEKKLALDALKETQRLLPLDSPERPKVDGQIAELERLVNTNKPIPQTPAPTPSVLPKTTTPKKTGEEVKGEIRLPSDLGLPTETPPETTPKE